MENKAISFSLQKVTTEQFAIIEGAEIKDEDINLETKFRFGINEQQKMIACLSSFTFIFNQKPFIIIEASCHFKILDESWTQMLNDKKDSIIAPKGFLCHLAMLTVGTSRGILHAKTEGTCFNKYVLPTINVSQIFTEDIVFDLNS